MAFISLSNTSSGKGEVPTASVPTVSSQVSTVSTEVAAASLSHDTICAYMATQSSACWMICLKKTGKKITIQGSDVAGFDKSKVKGHFTHHKSLQGLEDRSILEACKPSSLISVNGGDQGKEFLLDSWLSRLSIDRENLCFQVVKVNVETPLIRPVLDK
ncbi:hypothetical protein Tco_1131016 [Tanacetum coccineum]